MSMFDECVDQSLQELKAKRKLLISYLIMKLEEEDWHGVEDAASDIRDNEAEQDGLRKARSFYER